MKLDDDDTTGTGPAEVEVRHSKAGSKVHVAIDADAVAECLRKDGFVNIKFDEIGSAQLADLPHVPVIVN